MQGWKQIVRTTAAMAVLSLVPHAARAQASAIPSAQTAPDTTGDRGHKLLDQMIAALGGDAWVNRSYWVLEGKVGTFYKGQPTEGTYGFQEFYRAKPFAERVILITHFGVFIATDHKDVQMVWTPDNGYEVTYKGKKDLPEKDVAEHKRRHAHDLDVVVKDWLHQPGVIVTYEGTNMVERHLAEKVSIVTADNDAATLELDETSHLPLSLSYQYRDPVFKDFDTDTDQFDDYHPVQGIMTPYTITYLHNGDMVSQRFITKVRYETKLDDNLFDPERPLDKKAK